MLIIYFFRYFCKMIHIKYYLIMWTVVKPSIHSPHSTAWNFLIITDECPLAHLVTLRYFLHFCSKVTPHVLSAELTIPHFSCLITGTPCLSASIFTNGPFLLQKLFAIKKIIKKLLDLRHVAIGNHDPCHWVSLPSVPKQQGRMNKNGDTETMEENSGRKKRDDLDRGRHPSLYCKLLQ